LRRAAERPVAPVRRALGRQPAEGAAREVVPDRAEAAAARRADPGRRRRRAAADLRAHPRRGGGARDARRLRELRLRAARDDLRPGDRLRARARLPRARGLRALEGADRRAVLRGDGRRGGGGGRVTEATEAAAPSRHRARPWLADALERYALL